MMKTAYDLSREFIEILADIDRALDAKSKTNDSRTIKILDEKIDSLEVKMYDLKNALKALIVK